MASGFAGIGNDVSIQQTLRSGNIETTPQTMQDQGWRVPVDRNLAHLIGKNLRVVRESHGWTQARAAREVSLSHEFYARVERGLGLPSVMALLRIAEGMGVSPHRILGEAIEKQAEEYARRGLSDSMEYVVRFARTHPEHIPLILLLIKTFETAQGRG